MSARLTALQVVRDVFKADERQQRTAQESLDYHLRKHPLEPRDRALATELAYGAIKMRRLLDWYLRPYIGERRKPLPPATIEILRLGIYELLFMRSPQHAVVHEWVGLAKTFGHRGTAGLVNAILRGLLRDDPRAPIPEDFEEVDDYLATRYSVPTWIVKQWRGEFGVARLEEILKSVNEPAQPAVAVNTTRTSVDDALAWFAQHEITVRRSPLVDETLLIERNGFVPYEQIGRDGAWQLQSEAAAMPVDVLNPQPEESVLDVCSGRGNKALQAGARLAAEGTLTCIEKDPRKVSVLERRLEQAGIKAAVVTGDATQELLAAAFDRVVLDAPCSGIGIIGRCPEARWRKNPQDGARFAALQCKLLERMADRVYPGGVLVYSVCSTDPREGRDVIEQFVRNHRFERGLIPARYESFLTADGDVMIPPGIDGRDGFFIARLEKVA
ncbi:MAG: 16S rRNA (cytosine(967)-C(5))-methyltransferase RsmB [Candidatus Eremiobacteraeota bacterium]|nr:16S rRNA (cytosine(967)-C(5))-methyltransferase RsmB [Candidatus Eremiobacteraeota bacterium]